MREQVPYVTPMIIFDLEREDKGRKLRAKRVKKMQRGESRTSHALAIIFNIRICVKPITPCPMHPS